MNPPGPVTLLGPSLGVFEQSLQQRGYTPRTVSQYVGKCRSLDFFLVQRRMSLDSLAEGAIEEFLSDKLSRRAHHDERSARGCWTRPLTLLLEHLQREGAVTCAAPRAPAEPPIVLEYASFLRGHRGVSARTVEGQKRYLMRLLDHMGATRETDIPGQISPDRIDRFLVDLSERLCRQSINSACSALRGFLRYLHLRGLIKTDVAAQVMRPRLYSLASIPRALDWRDVEKVLALADRTTLTGCRDYAILVLLAYCGLRAGEVVGLRLADIDWSHDTIHLHRPKCTTVDPIPLVPLVGEALITYLRRRPAASLPQVFLKVLAPAGPMSSSCITMLTRKYLLQAGVTLQRLGAHTLRHSYAVRLLRQGFPLKTIGDALGHLHPQSTFIYTKAAVDDLRSVSLDVTEVLP